MATSDFLPFATGAGANVMSQADWEALAQRLSGFQSGVAQSAQLNKAWRQASIMAAVLAQFIADQSGEDAVDDGTTATLLANLKAAAGASSVGVVGSMRNGRMSVAAASSTATFTADEIIVESALGGLTYRLANFNESINLATTGAGGMDTGTAPASGYVALYAIHNPTTGDNALLATNATAAVQPEVYGGANMPAGYTASALVSVWPTNANGHFVIGFQSNRRISIDLKNVLTTNVQQDNPILLSIASAVPKNAIAVWGEGSIASSATGSANDLYVISNNGTLNLLHCVNTVASSTGASMGGFSYLPLIARQTMFYKATSSIGTMTATLFICGYEF